VVVRMSACQKCDAHQDHLRVDETVMAEATERETREAYTVGDGDTNIGPASIMRTLAV